MTTKQFIFVPTVKPQRIVSTTKLQREANVKARKLARKQARQAKYNQ